MPTFRAGFAHPLVELRDDLDRLWTTLTTAPPLHGWGTRPAAGSFPAVNVSESEDRLTVEAELPGLDAGDVSISVTGEELVLEGARPGAMPGSGRPTAGMPPADARVEGGMAAEDGGMGRNDGGVGRNDGGVAAAPAGNGEGQRGVIWHRRERGTGRFERRIPLPVPVDASRVEARLVDGVLTVTCPKAPEAQPRKVEVRST
jgi:HSP20 family molecular chaperone IbpA